MTALPEAEVAFFWCAMAQLEPELRPVFAQRVSNALDAYAPRCEPGEGDIDRAIRAALAGLWVPPPDEETKTSSRWDRNAAGFERVSKAAQPVEEQRHRRLKPGFGFVPA